MNLACCFEKASRVSIVAAPLLLAAIAACLPDMASAAAWTHDGVYGDTAVVALPGGQATLARDGADQQARTIIHTANDGDTTTIMRDYGPSGSKAIEVEKGAVRHHVYGNELSPLLRVESDGSLTYQLGMSTVQMSSSGQATVAHRVGDFKGSTVAVLDSRSAPQQRVGYRTLGQAQAQNGSGTVYALAAQLSGYEGLTLWVLGPDQLMDNRARIYAPTAGRFLALDASHQARAYEARSNDWIARADYDGNLDFVALAKKLAENPDIPISIGEIHFKKKGFKALHELVKALKKAGVNYVIIQESNLLLTGKDQDQVTTSRSKEEQEIIQDWNDEHRIIPLTKMPDMFLQDRQRKSEILAQLKKSAYADMLNQASEQSKWVISPSLFWDIPDVLQNADYRGIVKIFFFGQAHIEPGFSLSQPIVTYSPFNSSSRDHYVMELAPDYVGLQLLTTFELLGRHNMMGITVGNFVPLYAPDDSNPFHHFRLTKKNFSVDLWVPNSLQSVLAPSDVNKAENEEEQNNIETQSLIPQVRGHKVNERKEYGYKEPSPPPPQQAGKCCLIQ